MQFNKYKVYDDINVLRCCNCYKYGHSDKNFENNLVYYKCSKEHLSTKCTKVSKNCINCEFFNKKYKNKYNCEHDATDEECDIYKMQKLKKINRIDYEEGPLLLQTKNGHTENK